MVSLTTGPSRVTANEYKKEEGGNRAPRLALRPRDQDEQATTCSCVLCRVSWLHLVAVVDRDQPPVGGSSRRGVQDLHPNSMLLPLIRGEQVIARPRLTALGPNYDIETS